MVINKRVFRGIWRDKIKNLLFIILLCSSIIIFLSFSIGTNSILYSLDKFNDKNNLEDGQFQIIEDFEENLFGGDVLFEKIEYLDYSIKKDITLRIFNERKNINIYQITSGRDIYEKDQIVIDKNFAEAQKLSLGDTIFINNIDLKIVGFAIAPDYICTKKNQDILQANSLNFGIAFLKDEDFNYYNFDSVRFYYSYKLFRMEEQKFLDILTENYTLTNYINVNNNSRVTQIVNDATAPRELSMIISIFIFILIIIVISIDIADSINKEKNNIFALYAMGYNAREMFFFYLKKPLFLLIFSFIPGIIIGILLIEYVIYMHKGVYNYPIMEFTNLFIPFLVLSIILPLILTIIITFIIVYNKLNITPLEFLKPTEKIKNKKRNINFPKILNFVSIYRLRFIIRNKGNLFIFIIAGFMVSILIIFSFNLKFTVDEYMNTLNNETSYENMLILDGFIFESIENGENAMMLKLYIDRDIDKEIFIQTIQDDSKFFIYDVLKGKKGEIAITNALSKKYGYNVGDEIILYSILLNKYFTFEIDSILDYTSSCILFIKRDKFNEIFEVDDNIYNVVFLNDMIDNIEVNYTHTTKSEILTSGKSILEVINTMVTILIIFSLLTTVIILYIIAKYNIDKNTKNISMLKILGYENNEVNRMYAKWNLIMFTIIYFISLPISVFIITAFFDKIIGNLNNYIETQVSIIYSLIGLIIILFAYQISSILIRKNIKKIPIVEILKGNE